MIKSRDLVVASITIIVTLIAVRIAAQNTVMQSTVFDWNAIAVKQTDVGSVRQFFRSPTITLDELECHVTTLQPGLQSHPPHKHVNEELVIIREGTVEVLSNGEWKKAGPGSVIFNASNQLHALKNVGSTPAIYHVINWKSASK
ncbi:MAG TPA: cupin domain-containing protein [Pyrinomonadaceae bacterium]|nr:cupin domain-containing protein [Pyrinomonadaceae bacterium]